MYILPLCPTPSYHMPFMPQMKGLPITRLDKTALGLDILQKMPCQKSVFRKTLEPATRYAGLLLAPAKGFGLQTRLFFLPSS